MATVATTGSHAIAFPKLDCREIEGLSRCPRTRLRGLHDGDVLFRRGDRDFAFFIIVSGKVAIVDEGFDPPRTVVVHEAGNFTGDVAQLVGAASLATAVARGEGSVLEVPAGGVREIINQAPDIGDRILHALIARRELLREPATFTGLRVIGSRFSKDTFRIRDFLSRNQVPFTVLDVERDEDVKKLLDSFGVSETETPLVTWGRDVRLRNPSNSQLADALGLRRAPEQKIYDLVIIGAGPAGLAAAVYASSEGLHTMVLERSGPGGQAGRSMRIENYLGFPTGITGAELAERAAVQVAKFGAELPIATDVDAVSFGDNYTTVALDGQGSVTTKCLLIATGADYRRLDAEGLERFEGCGVYYAATPLEAPACGGGVAVVVGAGNSAGQAAVYLASQAPRVYIIVRGDSLYRSMSSYLAHRIEQTPNIDILLRTTVRRFSGDAWLRAVDLRDEATGDGRTIETTALFSFIGATPRTDWLPAEIRKDGSGFVLTGTSLPPLPAWYAGRPPYFLETSRPGVFAAGDVRSGSIKRVAAAVGEGSTAVQLVHQYLERM